jgi:hypothetical protein
MKSPGIQVTKTINDQLGGSGTGLIIFESRNKKQGHFI